MKRDMELVRKILIAIEGHNKPMGWVPLDLENYSEEEVSYHIKLLHEQDLIEAINCSSHQGICWRAKQLTWRGHDVVDAIKDVNKWARIKTRIKDAGKVLTLETLKEAIKTLFM